MEYHQMKTLRRLLGELKRDLDVEDVLQQLEDKGFLTEQNTEMIKNSATEEGMESFVDFLLEGGHQAFSVFIDALEECGETYEDLVEKLKDTEKSLKTVLEHEVREFESSLKGKEPFMFMDMVLNVAAVLDKSNVRRLSSHFKLSSKEVKEIKESGDPGIRFLQICYKAGLVTQENISELRHAFGHLKFARPHKTALEYEEALRCAAFTLTFKDGGNSDASEILAQATRKDFWGDHHRSRKIDYYCKGNYEARLFDIESGSKTMILKIPHLKSIDDLIYGIKSEEFVKVVLQSLFYHENQIDTSSSENISLRIEYDEEAYNLIRKELSPAENDPVSNSESEDSESSFRSTEYEILNTPEETGPVSDIPQYGHMLVQVIECITKEYCGKMGVMLNFTPTEQERASDATNLIRIMQEKDLLSEQNVNTLLDLLKALGIQKAFKVVERYKRAHSVDKSLLQTPEQTSKGPSFQTSATQTGVYAQDQSLQTHYYKEILNFVVPVLSRRVQPFQIINYMKGQSSFTEQDLRQVKSPAQRDKHKTFVNILKLKGYNDYELFLDHLLLLSPKSAKVMLNKEMELVPEAKLRKVRIGRLNRKTTMNVQENAIECCSKNNRNISVVLVGKTGSGKSSTANTLLGKDGAFNISQYFHQSWTDLIQLEETQFENTCLKVLDTPGLFDTRGALLQGMDNDARLLEIAKAVMVFPEGIDVFLIVCRLDEPFTQETQNGIEQIEKRFGGNLHFYDHCILILTRGKEMQAHTLKEHLDQSRMSYNLSQLIKKVQNRVIVVENKWTKSKHFKEYQREWLILQICSFIMQKDSASRGKYTNKHFTIAQQLLKSKAEDDLRNSSARKYTASFVRAYIRGADEETLQRLMNDKTLNENEIIKLKAFIEEKNLLTEHINVDISALASQIVSSSESIIQKQLFSKSREKDIMKQLEMDKNKRAETLEIKYQMQISILHFMDKNKDSLPSLESLLDSSTISRDLIDYANANEIQNYRLTKCEKNLDLTRKVLSDMENIVKLGIQIIQKEAAVHREIALEPNSASLTIEVLNVLKTFDISALKGLKCNAESGHLEQSIIWQQLSTLKLTQTDNSRSLIPAIVNKYVDSYIEVKDLEYIQMKEITKQKNLLKVENNISSKLFHEIERGDEKVLEELIKGELQQEIFQMLDIKLEEFPEITEKDTRSSLELSVQSIISIIKRRYNDVKTLRKELDEALKAHEKAEEERDEAEQRINNIVNEFSEKYIRGLKKRDMLNLKEQFEANELTIPPKLFEKIKKKVLQEDAMSDAEIHRIVYSVVRSKKQILEEIMNQESCFPSTSVITTLQAGKIPIGAVALGDKVLTVKDNFVLEYEEIFFIAHANKSGFFCYLILETSSKTSIAISPNHCLPVGNIKCLKPANQVKVNDLIFVNRDGIVISDTVKSIKREFRRGAYCPYTLNGTLIVDNIVASCFTTTVAPHIAQTVLVPLRCLYKCTPLPLYRAVFSDSKMKFISERAKVGSHVTENILLYIKNAF